MDREASDVATGEKQRRHHVTVGRNDHAAWRWHKGCLVVALREPFVIERHDEQLLDELRHRAPAAAV
jgi:hypothetical protein